MCVCVCVCVCILLSVQSRKLQQDGWKPRWFQMDSETGTYRYVGGGYWEGREKMNWVGCPHIFNQTLVDNDVPSCA